MLFIKVHFAFTCFKLHITLLLLFKHLSFKEMQNKNSCVFSYEITISDLSVPLCRTMFLSGIIFLLSEGCPLTFLVAQGDEFCQLLYVLKSFYFTFVFERCIEFWVFFQYFQKRCSTNFCLYYCQWEICRSYLCSSSHHVSFFPLDTFKIVFLSLTLNKFIM